MELRLHPEVRCSLKVVLKSLNPLPEIVVPAEKEVQKTEKRGKRPAAEEAAEAPAKGAKGGKGEKK